MKKILLIAFVFSSLLNQAQSILKMGCGEYGRYPISAADSFVYEDFWNGKDVRMTKTNTQGEKIVDICGAQYSALGISTAGSAWVFGQGSITPTRISTDTTGAAFTGNTACAAYFFSYVTIRKGALWYWGGSAGGGDDMKFFGKVINRPVPLKMPAGVTFTRVRMGNIILALSTTGDLWEYDQGNQTPHKVALPGPVSDYACSHTGFYIAIVNGDPWGWGFEYPFLGLTAQPAAPVNLKTVWGVAAPIVRITANHNTIHYIDVNHNLYGMGDNVQGEVGTGQELVNRAELYHNPPYSQARPYAWSWMLHGWMISKPVQIGAGIQWKDIWQDESYAFYWYALDMKGIVYFDGRGKSWVAGNDWVGNDIFPNAYDHQAPDSIDIWNGNVYMGTFVPGKVSAGPDHQVTGKIDSLVGAGTPSTGYRITGWSWTLLSGPAGCIIYSPTQQKSSVAFQNAGLYSFQLLMTDNNGATVADTVNVTVTIPNLSPVASAAAPDSIILPTDSVILDASASRDPDGTVVSYGWTQISGPSAAGLDNPQAARCLARQLQAGTYVFQVTVTDNQGLTGKATVAILVKPKPYIMGVETILIKTGVQVIIHWSDGSAITYQ